ncbi:hypothetical protein HG619_07800 [Pseudomonas syringae]|nr:hypothetical protein [Pseudomonas syringae]
MQTRDSQSGQVVTQPGDIADSVGAIDELVEAGPANKGEDSREKRTVPKPNANFMLTLIFANLLFIKSPENAFLCATKEPRFVFMDSKPARQSYRPQKSKT